MREDVPYLRLVRDEITETEEEDGKVGRNWAVLLIFMAVIVSLASPVFLTMVWAWAAYLA